MKRILCTGDSHAWGQGVKGLLEEFTPAVVAGDLRLASFRTAGYVNRLRRRVEEKTGSFSREWSAGALAALSDSPYEAPCAMMGERALTLPFTGSLLRVEYARGASPCRWELRIDGNVFFEGRDPAARGDNDFHIVHVHLPEGEHTLAAQAKEGVLPLYRVECYGGPFAVINAAVGSCPSRKYLTEFFAERAAPVRPDIVLAEAPSINDWLTGESPKSCGNHVAALLEAFRGLNAKTIMMTPGPIGGDQRWQGGPPYQEYVQASREAAARVGVPVCDANRIMAACLEGMTPDQAAEWLLDDPWHPNERGHAIYAELLFDALRHLELLQKASLSGTGREKHGV